MTTTTIDLLTSNDAQVLPAGPGVTITRNGAQIQAQAGKMSGPMLVFGRPLPPGSILTITSEMEVETTDKYYVGLTVFVPNDEYGEKSIRVNSGYLTGSTNRVILKATIKDDGATAFNVGWVMMAAGSKITGKTCVAELVTADDAVAPTPTPSLPANTFAAHSGHVATVPITLVAVSSDVDASKLGFSVEIYLGPNDTQKTVTSGLVEAGPGAGERFVRCPITMPMTPGVYHAYVKVVAGGIVVGAFQSQDVTVVDANRVSLHVRGTRNRILR